MISVSADNFAGGTVHGVQAAAITHGMRIEFGYGLMEIFKF